MTVVQISRHADKQTPWNTGEARGESNRRSAEETGADGNDSHGAERIGRVCPCHSRYHANRSSASWH